MSQLKMVDGVEVQLVPMRMIREDDWIWNGADSDVQWARVESVQKIVDVWIVRLSNGVRINVPTHAGMWIPTHVSEEDASVVF